MILILVFKGMKRLKHTQRPFQLKQLNHYYDLYYDQESLHHLINPIKYHLLMIYKMIFIKEKFFSCITCLLKDDCAVQLDERLFLS
jgi:hypothetical protein